jgi:hypothetical protein
MACAPGVICELISFRCSLMASLLAAGMMIAAPTARDGHNAPNKYTESRRLSRTARGREPMGAQTYSNVPCCPTLASSWNQISTGLPAAVVLPSRASFTRLENFF